MTITNGYCNLAELKRKLDIEESDNDDDIDLENIINAVSRWIDEDRRRRFFTTTNDETRYYTAEFTDKVKIDDLLSLTTLKTDEDGNGVYETTWTSSDYRLFPYNNTPYLQIEKRPLSSYLFPTYPGAVQVVGKFGYSSTVPPAIKEAALLMCIRVHGRKDKPFGISGSAELGTLEIITAVGKDDEIQRLLNTVKKRVIT